MSFAKHFSERSIVSVTAELSQSHCEISGILSLQIRKLRQVGLHRASKQVGENINSLGSHNKDQFEV